MMTNYEAVTFTPLEERIGMDDGSIRNGLTELKTMLSEQDYETYINSLISARQQGEHLLLITRYPLHRSILAGKFLPWIQEAFCATHVRIVSQSHSFNV